MWKRWSASAASGLLLASLGCENPSTPEIADESPGIALEGGSTLVFEDEGLLDAQRDGIVQGVQDTVSAVRRLMDVNGITIRVDAGTAYVIPEIGLGGRTTSPGEILIVVNPDSPAWPGSLSTELFPLLAHEMHHIMRIRAVGFGANLLEAMVTEGLADQFSIEVAGVGPPIWSTALSPDELELWSERARAQWYDSGYNHDAWFFGTGGEIPRWAGYSIGFDLTRAYILANPDRPPSQLYGFAASAFVPASE
jgi:uncharacterized protein YjaZ